MVAVSFRTPGVAVAVALFSVTVAQGQVSKKPRTRPRPVAASAGEPRADLRVDVPLVMIPVHVTTPLGASVTGLKKEEFRLFEDGVEQKITHFSNDDAPLSVGFLLDASSSMRNKMRKSVEAAGEFLKVTNPEDEFFLIRFGEWPKLTVPMTQDLEQVRMGLVRAKPIGRTSLLDAIHLSLLEMRHAHNLRKAIVILSDGGDNHSRYTESEIKESVREADVQIYAIGMFDRNDSPKRPLEERNGPHLLTDLADETGGKQFPVENLNDLPGICAHIGNELRDLYLLGYSPANSAQDGKYRHVEVVLAAPANVPPLRVRHRVGYYSPVE